MYHDVVSGESWDESGFPGADSARYKLSLQRFREHLHAIRDAAAVPPTIWDRAALEQASSGIPLLITFDDGGISSVRPIADELEELGWRGHFFVTTDFIGKPGFVDAGAVRELVERGHCVGSHSCSHPTRIAACSDDELRREWRYSTRRLADALGRPIDVASVPGGYYSTRVAEFAEAAGIRALFTSEPTEAVSYVGRCALLGRYTIMRSTPARVAAGLAGGNWRRVTRQTAMWTAKKAAKKLGGPLYLKFRALALGR